MDISDTATGSKSAENVEPTIGISTFGIQLGFLEGKILTIIDASYNDREQRSAVKDLAKKMFREQRRHVEDIAYKVTRTTYHGTLKEEDSNI